MLVEVQVSTGPSVPAADGTITPTYATPAVFTASIAGAVLNVTSIAGGLILVGQAIQDQGGLVQPGTLIADYGTGGGGVGTYIVTPEQTVSSEAMNTYVRVPAQVQPLSWRDIQMMDGLNLQGTRKAIYLYGRIDGLERPSRKGGDLIILPDGSVWLVAMILEAWNPTAGWTKAAITLQNDQALGPLGAVSDAQPLGVP